jgi:peptide-methionine (S)-S-oxide reductase
MNRSATNATLTACVLLVVAVAAIARGLFTMTDAPSPGKQARPEPAAPTSQPESMAPASDAIVATQGLETATLGAGCFWCIEAVFQQLNGVRQVVSGYSGGHVKNPTYENVCSGATGHAEVIRITFDPKLISYAELLEVFWKTHDPTTLNRQGNDVGTQYRSVVFYHNDEQRREAEHYQRKLDESGAFATGIVTEISPSSEFYPAEDYHQNYFADNPRKPYCAAIIQPKVDKLKKVFQDKLK